MVLFVGSVLVTSGSGGEDRAGPIRIGALTVSWGPTPYVVGLRGGLQELGYRENEDFVIGVRFTQGDMTALPAAAHELIHRGVDIIFADSDASVKAAQRATTRAPIVFAGVGDPVGLGLVQSFARPGGNITGVTDLELELGPKRLELFQEIVPGLKRVLFPYDAADTYALAAAPVYRDAAQRLGMVLVEKPLRTGEEAQVTLSQVRKDEVDGILGSAGSPTLNIFGLILQTASRRGIPTMFNGSFLIEQGGLTSYGPDFYETGRQAARLVDKILKGADPATIPVEVNPKIEFAINLKVAKSLGLTIAPEVLYRADRLVR